MKNIFKFGVLPIVIFVFLLIVTVMLMPVLINVQKYVPEIEKSISKASGRPFSVGPDVAVSFFPWLSLTFSDMKLGNPPGFVSEALVKIDFFEARIKLLPLLKKEIQVSRFVVGGLEVNLEKNTEGKINWEFLQTMAAPRFAFLEDSIFCTLLAITDGRLHWIDRENHVRHTVDDLMLLLNNVQADRPIALDFKAAYDGKPVALEGKIGPFRRQQGSEVPIDIGFRLVETLEGQIQGQVESRQSPPVYDVALQLSPFSPRTLSTALGLVFPVEAGDPSVFQEVELDLAIKGGGDMLRVEKGTARLDDTRMVFSGEVKNFKKPELRFALDLDRLNLDRYFPAGQQGNPALAKAEQQHGVVGAISLLTKSLPFAGTVRIEELQALGAAASRVEANLGGREGVLTMDGASMKLYGGQLQANLAATLSGESPKMRVAVQSQGVDAAGLLREMSGREILTGTLSADMVLELSGDTPVAMQNSLGGEATFSCLDGALLGVDLVRSIESRKLVEAASGQDRNMIRTDFSELKGAVTIDNGLLDIREATLTSPSMALVVGGRADIPGRAWDLQVARQGLEAKPKKGKSLLPLYWAGTLAAPEGKVDIGRRNGEMVAAASSNVANLVDEKIPSPIDDDVKDLVGKPLIDPAIVAQRFHLQRETIRRSEMKKQLQLGSGKIRINPLLEETSPYSLR